jgi:hypothetical protein
MMLRVLAALTTLATAAAFGVSLPPWYGGVDRGPAAADPTPLDVRALLAEARGAPPRLCALAARAIGNGGWGRGADAPVTPLRAVLGDERDDVRRLAAVDVATVVAELGSADRCVQELAVRIVGASRTASSPRRSSSGCRGATRRRGPSPPSGSAWCARGAPSSRCTAPCATRRRARGRTPPGRSGTSTTGAASGRCSPPSATRSRSCARPPSWRWGTSTRRARCPR